MTEAVQDQELQFWEMWKKASAPDASMEGDKSTNATQEDGRTQMQLQTQGLPRRAGEVRPVNLLEPKEDARIRVLKSQVQSLARLAVRHEDAIGTNSPMWFTPEWLRRQASSSHFLRCNRSGERCETRNRPS